MALIHFVQRASILAGITFAGITFHGGSATAQTDNFCVVASNGKTACGTLKAVERACVSTDNGVVCGKFKSVAAEQGQAAAQPEQTTGYRKESDGINYLLRNCNRSNSDVIKCNLVINTKKENKSIYLLSGKGNSSIVDSAGKTYPSSTLEHNGFSSTFFNVNLSPDVDYVVDLNIENVPGQINQAALVSIENSRGKVTLFRNVPFSN